MNCWRSGSGKLDSISCFSFPVWVFFKKILIISDLTFPQEKNTDVSKEDFLLALEVSQNVLHPAFSVLFLLDYFPALWRGQQQSREQEGDRTDLLYHHPARVRRQIRLWGGLHRPGDRLNGPRQVRDIQVMSHSMSSSCCFDNDSHQTVTLTWPNTNLRVEFKLREYPEKKLLFTIYVLYDSYLNSSL